MKSSKEYLKNVFALTKRNDLYAIGEQMQKDAYLEALKDVGTVLRNYDKIHFPTASQSLILTELFLEIEQLEILCKEPKE